MEKEVKSGFKRICVFCGSSFGKRDSYREAAVELGKELVSKGIELVYGGGSLGLMGIVAKTVHDSGGHVLGIIPQALAEVAGDPIGELQVVPDMHQRKATMAAHADAFIALPGGYGTMEEFLEVTCWAQLKLHRKPMGILNIDGFYDFFLSFTDEAVREGFIPPKDQCLIISAPTAKELIEKMEEESNIPQEEPSIIPTLATRELTKETKE